jgi:uncharacterized protein YkwD
LYLPMILPGAVARFATAGTHGPLASVAPLESRTFQLVNEHRRSRGIPPLAYDAGIAAVARRHSEEMAAGRVPAGHEGFEKRGRAISKTIPWKRIAENVGFNDYPPSQTVRTAVSGWLGSRGHRGNIEGRYDVTGVGIARDSGGAYHYTQIFVKR